jgi:chemosensory pili system protein ChpA (sensor histidine kinase/response regulator)
MDATSSSSPAATDDLSSLAWVHEELRKTLEQAHKHLRRCLRDAQAAQGDDLGDVDPTVLRNARHLLHQGVGALELVNVPEGAVLLRASEALVQKFVAKPATLDAAAVDAVEHGSFALLDYFGRRLVGKPAEPVALFPQLRTVLEKAGSDRVHPADLWFHDWRWRSVAALPAQAQSPGSRMLAEFERRLLSLVRQSAPADAAALCADCNALAAGARSFETATFWRIAAGFFEAWALGLVPNDVFAKRTASRVLGQLRALVKGETEVAERLALDLLFYCARAVPPAQRAAAALQAVRSAYELPDRPAVPYDTARYGRFDPAAILQARKRAEAARQAWSEVAGGELHRVAHLAEPFSLLGDSIEQLLPDGARLAAALRQAAERTAASGRPPGVGLGMEIATSLLYLEAALEEGEFDEADGERAERLAVRIEQAAAGGDAQPLDRWMEELYRRVADRQTLGSVVQELRASLGEAETQIDRFFRRPDDTAPLADVPRQLATMRGVLAVLGIEPAAQALVRMREDVQALLDGAPDGHAGGPGAWIQRLAGNLGALGFLIDMLNVQPQLARALFVYDPLAGMLAPLMGRQAAPPEWVDRAHAIAEAVKRDDVPLEVVSAELKALSEQPDVVHAPVLAERIESAQLALEQAAEAGAGPVTEEAVREHVAQAMNDFVATATSPIGLDPLDLQSISRPIALDVPVGEASITGLEDDAEMREVFLEESREVLDAGRQALAGVNDRPDSLAELTVLRRVFHTLKGSARMVGLLPFGDAAWAGEQLFNHWLATQAPASVALRVFTAQAFDFLGQWVEAIALGQGDGFDNRGFIAAADHLRLTGELRSIDEVPEDVVPEAVADVDVPVHAEAPLDLPPLDLPVADLPVAEPVAPESPPSEPVPLPFVAEAAEAAPEAAPEDIPAPIAAFDLPLDVSALEALDALAPPAGAPEVDLDLPVDDVTDLPVVEPLAATQPAPLESPELPPVSSPWTETAPYRPAPAPVALDVVDLDLTLDDDAPPVPVDEPLDIPLEPVAAEDTDRQIGPLRVPAALFNIYLQEADELSRRLSSALADWAQALDRPVGEEAITAAHSLAGNSATVGYDDLAQLARALEDALVRADAAGWGLEDDAALFNEAADAVRGLLHQFAAGFMPAPSDALQARLQQWCRDVDGRVLVAEPPAPLADEPDLSIEPALAAEPEPEPELEAPDAVEAVDLPLDEAVAADELSVDLPIDVPAEAPVDAALPATALHPEPVVLRDIVPPADLEMDIDQDDVVDADLFPIFEEEAEDLLPRLTEQVRAWLAQPSDLATGTACMRTLHTFKGGARLAGAMRLGEMAHRFETAVQQFLTRERLDALELEPLHTRADALVSAFERLRRRARGEEVPPSGFQPLQDEVRQALEATAPGGAAPLGAGDAAAPGADAFDWSRLPSAPAGSSPAERTPVNTQPVRVRIQLLDRLVNLAGEVSITRARLESEVAQVRGVLGDLTDNLERLNQQLRDLALQADTQLQSRREAARAAQQDFDPLELDRYTRVQELTRMMAESVDDVATVRGTLQRTLQNAEDELASQTRLTRELQGDLLRTRMVEFEGLSDRLYRVVRQAAKETGKQVRLDIVGGAIEVDRSVLDRMTPAFEHLLRNAVSHGIEAPEVRTAAAKDPTGSIVITVEQEGNEVTVEIRDDGTGLDAARIRERAVAMGLVEAQAELSDKDLSRLIFAPGLSTASALTELAGRGVGMDVVRADVQALGGRIETRSQPGKGTRFRLVLPLTTVVTQVVLLRVGSAVVAVPSNLVELVQRATPFAVETAYRQGRYLYGGLQLPFYWLGALVQGASAGALAGRTLPVVIVRSAQQRVALHVDEVQGSHEVVVKNLGPQLARVPGLAGMTLLASGQVALIYNPVTLAGAYGDDAQRRMRDASLGALGLDGSGEGGGDGPAATPLILVVDDSLTVRRVTKRLLEREGYRVTLAKDGLEALDALTREKPAVVLSDIEMPRMDGFDLLRNIRADANLQDLPVVMITSRIAEKHRDHALEMGANHYLGKPYAEDDLIRILRRHVAPSSVNA